MGKVLIKSGQIVTAVDEHEGDILLEDGKIEAIGRALDVADAAVHDAQGLLVIPGGIDAHVHMETPMGNGVETCDTFESGTRSAAFGGTTTIVDFALQFKGESPKAPLDRRLAAAEPQCCVDYGFHSILTDVTDAAPLNWPRCRSTLFIFQRRRRWTPLSRHVIAVFRHLPRPARIPVPG